MHCLILKWVLQVHIAYAWRHISRPRYVWSETKCSSLFGTSLKPEIFRIVWNSQITASVFQWTSTKFRRCGPRLCSQEQVFWSVRLPLVVYGCTLGALRSVHSRWRPPTAHVPETELYPTNIHNGTEKYRTCANKFNRTERVIQRRHLGNKFYHVASICNLYRFSLVSACISSIVIFRVFSFHSSEWSVYKPTVFELS